MKKIYGIVLAIIGIIAALFGIVLKLKEKYSHICYWRCRWTDFYLCCRQNQQCSGDN